jgi:putative ABC transport system permease protein
MQSFISSCEVFLEDGFMYSLLAMGFYITYSILDFPDLSVEGTVLSGGVVAALMITAGINPWLAMIASFVVGALFGSVTGLLHVKLRIRPLLCGILVSTALISVNLVITVVGMGGQFNGEGALTTIPIDRKAATIVRDYPAKLIPQVEYINLRQLLIFFAVAVIFKLLLDAFLKTKCGLLLRAAGNNERFVSMLARNPGNSKILGLALGNGLAAVSGAMIVQSRGNANQSMGLGMVVIGLASVIIGLSLFNKVRFMKPTSKVIIGSVIYQACLSAATMLGVPTAYNKLIMAVLFTIALVISGSVKGQRRSVKC